MRKQRITYKDLARKLLAGRLLRREERRQAEAVLVLGDALEEARAVGALLAALAARGDLIRLPSPEDRPGLARYLDPASNDHWSVELPGPRPVARAAAPPPIERAPPATPPAGARTAAPQAAARRPTGREPAPAPRIVEAVLELDPDPAVAPRFRDAETGEPLRTLFSAFAPCSTPEELGESLAPIRGQLLERTSATGVRFHLLGDGGDELIPVPVPGEPTGPAEMLGTRVRERVLGARRTLHVPNLAAPGAGGAGTGAHVALPLFHGDRPAGLMEARRDAAGPFDEDELRFFALAALAAAGIVGRAEVLEKLIFIDKLTGLYNRAYFDDQIEREIERANRSNTSVALLMADLDHFKRINDNFGHQAGDVALSHVASLIRANIRQIDVAARYGGEEFAVLLPSITRVRAVRTAERLRRVISQSRIGDLLPDLAATRLSVSIGIALYPDDAGTSKQLLDRADRVALYAAKHHGRNRVVSWADARDTTERLRPGA
jgi:diguanylate cyclase (GGDEF)-like protein